jgi:hypothetical protein
LKIRSPTSVDCRLVIRAKWVKKATPAVPNAPVVPLAKRVPVLMGLAEPVMRGNHVNPMIQTRLRARSAKVALIKTKLAKHLVYRAYLARMKTIPVQPNVQSAALGNTKMYLAMTLV